MYIDDIFSFTFLFSSEYFFLDISLFTSLESPLQQIIKRQGGEVDVVLDSRGILSVFIRSIISLFLQFLLQ